VLCNQIVISCCQHEHKTSEKNRVYIAVIHM
jgi:hypothetical protein